MRIYMSIYNNETYSTIITIKHDKIELAREMIQKQKVPLTLACLSSTRNYILVGNPYLAFHSNQRSIEGLSCHQQLPIYCPKGQIFPSSSQYLLQPSLLEIFKRCTLCEESWRLHFKKN